MTLKEFFAQHPRAAVAFSGGTDSALVLWAAKEYGADVTAYYVRSPFQPAFELADAQRLAGALAVPLKVGGGGHPVRAGGRRPTGPGGATTANGPCSPPCGRRRLPTDTSCCWTAPTPRTTRGTRPGMQALAELAVRSPLRECGLTKQEVRRLSREAGLFTWDKPAYACLATRVPTGTPITAEDLARVERGEETLFRLGFTDFRLRLFHGAARIQVPAEQTAQAAALRQEIIRALEGDFSAVLLDLAGR